MIVLGSALVCPFLRKGLGRIPIMFHVLDGVAKANDTVGQQICEVIGWNDYYTDINVAVLEIITDVGNEGHCRGLQPAQYG